MDSNLVSTEKRSVVYSAKNVKNLNQCICGNRPPQQRSLHGDFRRSEEISLVQFSLRALLIKLEVVDLLQAYHLKLP